jgi:hypothetical protein
LRAYRRWLGRLLPPAGDRRRRRDHRDPSWAATRLEQAQSIEIFDDMAWHEQLRCSERRCRTAHPCTVREDTNAESELFPRFAKIGRCDAHCAFDPRSLHSKLRPSAEAPHALAAPPALAAEGIRGRNGARRACRS